MERACEESSIDFIKLDPKNNKITPNKNKLNNVDQRTKIYIEMHGDENGDIGGISDIDNEKHRVDISTLAATLAAALPDDLKQKQTKPTFYDDRLTISLITCYGGHFPQNEPKNSAAAKLQAALNENGIHADVMARKTLIWACSDQLGVFYTTSLMGSENLPESEIPKVRHQENSKVIFTWATENSRPVQVAYDAYEFRQHQTHYQQVKAVIQKLREYADKRAKKTGYQTVYETATNLAIKLDNEVNRYFNQIAYTPESTNQFKQTCLTAVKKANEILATHRDPLWKRIIGKLTLAIASTVGLSIPYFIHKRLVKSGVGFSQSLFSNKTAGKKLTNKLRKSIDAVKTLSTPRNIEP
ncbi:MAG: hypothetical protein KDH94_00440, partial [Coxiellaceae bacterium]|nr:hypothetical protein [Coxiellaceae bacterium]